MIAKKMKNDLASKGITITETPDGSDFKYSAYWENPEHVGVQSSIEFFYDDKAKLATAIQAARMAAIEHRLQFDQSEGELGVTITFGPNNREIGKVEDLADLVSTIPDVLDTFDPSEVDAIAESDAVDAEEEDKRSGSVVPDRYKTLYKEAGHPNTCGDWLADTLGPLTTLANGKLDADAMAEVARLNGIATDKLNRTTPGWQGRFRMTARNMLVKKVAASGFLAVPPFEGGDNVKAPADWLAANQPKVKEAGDKRAARKAKGA